MDEWTIYWITRCDGVRDGLEGLCTSSTTLGTVGLLVATVAFGMSHDSKLMDPKTGEKYQRVYPRLATCMAILLAIGATCKVANVFVPTTKEMCAIVALPAIARNEDAQEVGREVVDLAKEWLKELNPVSKETK